MTTQLPNGDLTFDGAIAAQFIAALTGHPETPIQWQIFDDNNDRKKETHGRDQFAKSFYDPLSIAWGTLAPMNAAGAGIFYTVNITDGMGRAASNITGLRACFVDKDDGYLDSTKIILPPSIRIMSSPGKEHALWLLHPGQDLAEFEHTQRILMTHFGGDLVVDLPRVLRLPGSIHRKVDSKKGVVGAPFRTYVGVFDPTRRYTLRELQFAYPPLREAAKRPVTASLAPSSSDAAGVQEGKRNNYLTSVAGRLRASGTNEDELLTKVREENSRLGEPLDDAEVERITRSVGRYAPKVDHDFNAAIAAALPPAPVFSPAAPSPAYASGAGMVPWTSYLLVDAKNIPKSCVANGITVMENHDAWRGVLGLNVRYAEIWFMSTPPCDRNGTHGSYPRAMDDGDIGRIAQWFAYAQGMGDFAHDRALLSVAQRQKFDPVVQNLDSLIWDGTERLITAAQVYCAADGPPDYLAAVMTKWFIQAIARAMMPGCQADMTLILEGAQGAGKTSFFRALAGKHLGENPPKEFGQKMHEFIRGPWIVEFGELSSFKKGEIEDIKAFLTNLTDRYRPAYGRVTGEFPRRCVFGGSTNGKHYLSDPEGNRRYAPIACGELDTPRLLADRDQLFAEAVALYDSGIPWRVLKNEIPIFATEQSARVLNDALVDDVGEALAKGVRRDFTGLNLGGSDPGWVIPPNPESVSVGEICRSVFQSRDQDTRLQARVATALKILGREVDRATGRWRKNV